MKKPGLGQLYGSEHSDKLGNNEEACKLNEKKKDKGDPHCASQTKTAGGSYKTS